MKLSQEAKVGYELPELGKVWLIPFLSRLALETLEIQLTSAENSELIRPSLNMGS